MPSAPDTGTSSSGWPKRRRLLRRADFRATYELGVRRSSRSFTIFGQPRPQAGARFGITASKKLGSAVVRNRLRRRTRELLRRLPAIEGWGGDFVINPRLRVAEADFKELAQELREQISKLCASLESQKA